MSRKHLDAPSHVRGQSIYVDDIPVRKGTLYGVPFGSPIAHGVIQSLDTSAAEACSGVHTVLTAHHIPGQNQIGNIIDDEALFAADEVHFQGQPIALVLAESEDLARHALAKIKVDIKPLPVITDARQANQLGKLIHPPRTFSQGDVDAVWSQCAHIFEGQTESGGQEHLYIETQGSYAWTEENGHTHIVSSTQGPTVVQRMAARVLGVPMHKVQVEVRRLGGGFGGKEDQANAWGAMAALGANLTGRAVKVILHRLDDIAMTGKRHPYSSDFKIGLDADHRIIAFEASYFQNAGAAADLSPAVLERTLFHGNNSYYIPNFKATAYPCYTHLPPNTAFRGFGGPQGMFVIESAIAEASRQLGIPARTIQKANLIRDGHSFPYGQIAAGSQAHAAWDDAAKRFDVQQIQENINDFNANNHLTKRGLALMPVCFGISFTKTALNQAGALVHIYQDGSVGISTAAVEMGQGVNAKLHAVAQTLFSIGSERIKIESTDTTRVANTSPTAASAAADLNGKALQMACEALLQRLRTFAVTQLEDSMDPDSIRIKDECVFAGDQPTHLDWPTLVNLAYWNRVNLSEHAHYATPQINFDPKKEKGHPFAYHVYGTAVIEAEVDCLRGRYTIERAQVTHDFGKSLHPLVDLGQAEGGLVQGIGWMTCEEVAYNEEGRLLSNALSTYKVPDIYAAPKILDVHFLEAPGSPHAIFRSKAIGEPPLMYGIGAYFAIRNAILAFNPEAHIPYDAPITPEKVLLALYSGARNPNQSLASTAN